MSPKLCFYLSFTESGEFSYHEVTMRIKSLTYFKSVARFSRGHSSHVFITINLFATLKLLGLYRRLKSCVYPWCALWHEINSNDNKSLIQVRASNSLCSSSSTFWTAEARVPASPTCPESRWPTALMPKGAFRQPILSGKSGLLLKKYNS